MEKEFDFTVVDEILKNYPPSARSTIAILQDIQEHYHYLPEEIFPYVSRAIGVGEARLYHSDLSIYGACRMCMVEDERGRLMASCSTLPRAGMKIKTNTGRLRKYRKNILSSCQSLPGLYDM